MSDLHRRVADAARALEPKYSTLEATVFEADVRRAHRERNVAAGLRELERVMEEVRDGGDQDLPISFDHHLGIDRANREL